MNSKQSAQSGFSTVQAAVLATMVAVSVAGVSSVMVYQQRQTKITQYRFNYNQIITRANFYLNSMGTLKASETNIVAGTDVTSAGVPETPNGMFNVCMNASANPATQNCYQNPTTGAGWSVIPPGTIREIFGGHQTIVQQQVTGTKLYNPNYGYPISLHSVFSAYQAQIVDKSTGFSAQSQRAQIVTGYVVGMNASTSQSPCPASSGFNCNTYYSDGSLCPASDIANCNLELDFYMQPACASSANTCNGAQSINFTYVLQSIKPYLGVSVPVATGSYNVANPSVIAQATDSDATPTCDSADGYIPVGLNPDGSLLCALPKRAVNLLAKHYLIAGTSDLVYQTNPSPTPNPCTFNNVTRSDGSTYTANFTDMTQTADPNTPDTGLPAGARHSFAGIWTSPHAGLSANLGSLGSCINNGDYMNAFYAQCGTNGICRASNANNYSIWLRNLDSTPPQSSNIGVDGTGYISGCSVCVVNGPVVVVHGDMNSAANTIPACPAGYDRLYWGRSLASLSLHGTNAQGVDSGYSAGQDRNSPGSCIAMNTDTVPWPIGSTGGARMPFLQGDHTQASFALGFLTDYSTAQYNGTAAADSSSATPFMCSVCWQPPVPVAVTSN